MKTSRRQLRRTSKKQISHKSTTDTLGILRMFIRSPNEAIELAQSASSSLTNDLSCMLSAARELVRADKYDVMDVVVSDVRINWSCAFQNIGRKVAGELANDDSHNAKEIAILMSDLGSLFHAGIVWRTSSGTDGTIEYLTEWTEG